MKRFFVALVGLVVLVAAAAVVAPGFINWNDHRDRVSALLASQFGRDVDIAGALDLTLLPTPILSADDVRVGGDGENAPLTLSAIEVALAPVSLLSGELRVLRAIMVDPKVQVTRQPDGSLQWPVGVATEGPIPARLATLDRVTLSNGTIVIDDPDAGQVTEITDIFAQFSGDLTTGETSLTGSFQAAGVPLAIDLQSREQAGNGSLPVTLSLGIDGLDNELRYAGLVGRLDGGTALQEIIAGRLDRVRLQGNLNLSGSDLAEALRRLNLVEKPLSMLAQPFTLEARFNARQGYVETSKLAYSFGEIDGSGGLTFNGDQSPQVVLTTVMNRVDLDETLSANGGVPPSAVESFTALTEALSGLGSDDNGLVQLPDGEVRVSVDRLTAFGDEMRNVRLRLNKSPDRLALSGMEAIAPGGGTLRARGNVDWTTQPSGVSLSASLDESAFEPLAAWLGMGNDKAPPVRSISGQVSLDGNVKSLRAAEARVVLDASRLAGSFSRREDEAGVDLRLDVDRLNLDQYRPADGADTTVQWLTEHPFLVDLHDRLVADGIVGFRFAADELLVDEKRLSEVAGQGTIDGERLQLKNLSIAAFAQSAIRVAGHYRYAPPVEGSDEPVLEVTTSVVTEDVSGLADELVLSLPKFPQSPAAADLRVRVSGDPSALLKTSFSGTLGGFDVNVGGALDREGDPVWNGAVRLIHADASAVFDAYLTDYDPPGATGPFDVFARLDGGQGDVTFNELIGKVGSLVLAGDGQVEWDPKSEQIKPVIEATLRTGAIDIAEWLPARRTRTVGIWPSDRLSLNWVNWADLDLRVVGREVIWDDITLEKPALTMTSENGVLEVSRFSADGWGGRLGLSGTLGPDEAGYGLDGRIDVVGVDAERFLGQTVGASGIDGALDFGATVGTRGTSIRDFVGGMDGSALISVREGQIDNVDLAEAAQWVAADEEPVDFLNGLRGSLDEGVTPFQALNARMTVNQGRLHTDDLRIAAIETIGTGQGSFDLNKWEVDLTTDFALRRLPSAPPLALRLEGAAEKPQRRWLTEAVQAYVAQRAARALSNQFVEQPELDSEAALPIERSGSPY